MSDFKSSFHATEYIANQNTRKLLYVVSIPQKIIGKNQSKCVYDSADHTNLYYNYCCLIDVRNGHVKVTQQGF